MGPYQSDEGKAAISVIKATNTLENPINAVPLTGIGNTLIVSTSVGAGFKADKGFGNPVTFFAGAGIDAPGTLKVNQHGRN